MYKLRHINSGFDEQARTTCEQNTNPRNIELSGLVLEFISGSHLNVHFAKHMKLARVGQGAACACAGASWHSNHESFPVTRDLLPIHMETSACGTILSHDDGGKDSRKKLGHLLPKIRWLHRDDVILSLAYVCQFVFCSIDSNSLM